MSALTIENQLNQILMQLQHQTNQLVQQTDQLNQLNVQMANLTAPRSLFLTVIIVAFPRCYWAQRGSSPFHTGGILPLHSGLRRS